MNKIKKTFSFTVFMSVLSISAMAETDFSSQPNLQAAQLNNQGVSAEIEISNDWGGGYCAALKLTNTSSSAVTWSVSLDVSGVVSNLWSGTWNQSGTTLTVSGAGWNNLLQPGQVDTSVGFCANRVDDPDEDDNGDDDNSGNDGDSYEVPANNFAVNGDVEAGLINWSTTAGTLLLTTNDSHSGASSVLITARTSGWNGITFNVGTLTTGNQYDVAVWVKLAPGSEDATLMLTAKRQNDADNSTFNEYEQITTATVSDRDWTLLQGFYTQSGTPFDYFIIESEDAFVSFYADDFSVGGEVNDTGNVADYDKFVGNITTNGSVRPDFVQYWDQITPENEGKWGSVERSRDVYNWSGLDAAYYYAKQNNIPFKQHTFVWGSQYPSWIDSLSPSEQAAEIEEWIRDFCIRYPDVEMIDVVNEATPNHAPAGYAQRAFGDDWIIKSFQLARQHCPNAELILNDYNVLSWHTDEFIAMATPAINAGVVDAIGLQAHGLEDRPLSDVQSKLNRIAALGLPIYISELDIAKTDDQAQLNVMKTQFPLFYNHASVKGVTLWGYVVGATWRDGTGLIQSDGTPRPAMTWLMNYLQEQ